MVRPVSFGVEAAVVMSDTSRGVHFGLVCGSSSLQAGDSTRGPGESGVKARISLLSPGSVVGVSLLLARDTELSRSVGGLTAALLFITACSLSISSLYCFFSCFIFVCTCAGVQWKFLFFSSSASFLHTGAFLYVPNNLSWFATLLHRASKH